MVQMGALPGVGRKEMGRLQLGVQGVADDSRLHDHVAVVFIQFLDLVHPRQVQQDAALGGQGRTGNTGPGPTGHHRNFMGGGNLDHPHHLFGGLGENDDVRHPFMNRHVPGNTDTVDGSG